MKKSFSTLYPYLAWWCENHGYIQMGIDDDYNQNLVTVLLFVSSQTTFGYEKLPSKIAKNSTNYSKNR